MGRTKLYDRDALLDAAMRVFWQRGFADTSVQQLERATGVNKSGLYAEFKGKEDLYLASLRHYVTQRGAEGLLTAEPPGWSNAESLLQLGPVCGADRKGCFAINAMREVESLPEEAAQIVASSQAAMLALLLKNISVEETRMPPKAVAEIVLIFFSGLCIEMNLSPSPASVKRKVKNFMAMLKTL
ncbi:TetR/AcrR family transcriptional regulator [Duganella aceris]|uniref:TetR/AcrR family transcriptional regulator n=1 Tax=Duganella aceris TaxID=2703883 RepID=A0ABX0FNX8_9BURK|nr:TetR/AcrR family transcriptional regulator [Duganella aceris]NGZ86160.1 TetR/AcrR family transcriptional regulator [Duganella aceris]